LDGHYRSSSVHSSAAFRGVLATTAGYHRMSERIQFVALFACLLFLFGVLLWALFWTY
jgi:hypothetical protein